MSKQSTERQKLFKNKGQDSEVRFTVQFFKSWCNLLNLLTNFILLKVTHPHVARKNVHEFITDIELCRNQRLENSGH